MHYWPVAVVVDENSKAYTMFTYDSFLNEEEALTWLETVKQNTRVLISYIYDDNKKVIYHDTVFDKLDNVKDVELNKDKYYARAIIHNSEDNSFYRWFSYDEYDSEEEAKNRIKEIKEQFKTYFAYIETQGEDGNNKISYYENNVDLLGNVTYWDQTQKGSNKR